MDAKTLGAIIRTQRKSKHLTIAELAAHCNVGDRFISELENGKETIEIGKALKVIKRLNLVLTIIPTDTGVQE
ncbi:Helix-turn-helix [Trichlorobacter thiogenes]|uniref:Helix-turn-helix n=1 Tax=Trichlorobacter thiogenes TaxID=115783 RepID=A0A1T4S810_9BACT|nr:helix-turn-helix domain-containing protein [Trichlorobacter thiogenes]SKA24373.1 Helix-turn-helix [Trichlorobacter thiogenes]